jgi:hypothetical protein
MSISPSPKKTRRTWNNLLLAALLEGGIQKVGVEESLWNIGSRAALGSEIEGAGKGGEGRERREVHS